MSFREILKEINDRNQAMREANSSWFQKLLAARSSEDLKGVIDELDATVFGYQGGRKCHAWPRPTDTSRSFQDPLAV